MTNSPLRPNARRLRRVGWLLAVAIPCALRAFLLTTRGVDPDEFEHLHASFLVGRGQVPYRDFFEHHGPLLYYLVQTVPGSFDGGLEVLSRLRLGMWFCGLAALFVTYAVGVRIGGARVGALAACLLSWSTVFHFKSIELRPDVPAMLCVLVCFWCALVARARRHARHASQTIAVWCAAGATAGMATLLTQKSIVPLAAAAAAVWLAAVLKQRGRVWPIEGLAMAAGVVLAWLAAGAFFAAAESGRAFYDSTIVRLWIWPVRSDRWEHLRPTLAGDLAIWVAAAAGMVLALRAAIGGAWQERGQHRRLWAAAAIEGGLKPEGKPCMPDGAMVVGLAALFCVGSLGFVKATFPQYYLLWMPLLCLCAGRQLCGFSDWLAGRFRTLPLLLAGCAVLAAEVALAARGLARGAGGPFGHWCSAPPSALSIGWCCAAAAAAWLVLMGWALWRRRASVCVGLLISLGLAYGALRMVDSLAWTNAIERAGMERIHREVSADQTVLDGFTGWGALRMHAIYYWWLNEYSLALVEQAELESEILEALERRPPGAILFDENLQRLSARVLERMEARYAPAEPPPIRLPRRAAPATDAVK